MDGESRGKMAESLAEVAEAWGELPEALRAGILAMVRAAMAGRVKE